MNPDEVYGYVTDGKVLINLDGLRWACCSDEKLSRSGVFLDWDYKGSNESYCYGKSSEAKKLRDEMFDLIVDALASAGILSRTKTLIEVRDTGKTDD